jgi:hypothetical protein
MCVTHLQYDIRCLVGKIKKEDNALPDPRVLSSNESVCPSPDHRRVQRGWIAEPRGRKSDCPRKFVQSLKMGISCIQMTSRSN